MNKAEFKQQEMRTKPTYSTVSKLHISCVKEVKMMEQRL